MDYESATPDIAEIRNAILGGTTDITSLAAALTCSVRRIERLIQAGLPVIRIGRDRRFNLENCRIWLLSHESRPAEPPRRGRPRKAA